MLKDKIKDALNKEQVDVEQLVKEEKEVKVEEFTPTTEKETFSFMDKNSEAMERDSFGQLKLHKDLEALEDYKEYEKEILFEYESKEDKVIDFIKRGLYKPTSRDDFKLTDEEYKVFVKELYEIYNKNDRGDKAFYSAAMFTNSYALRMGRETLIKQYGYSNEELPKKEFMDGNIVLEDKSDRAVSTALYTALGSEDIAKRIVKNMAGRNFHPATPTYSNSGINRSGEPTSCYIFAVEDDIDGIQYAHDVALQKSKRGGGIGYDLSNIRAKGETIKGVKNRAKGVIPVAKMIEGAVGYADQDGKRPGSAVANLSVFHPDIEDFLNSKKENAEENLRLKTLSTAIITYDKFWEKVRNGDDFYTFYPRTVYEEYGLMFSDIDFNEMYDELVENPRIRKKKYNSLDIMSQVARLHGMRGYPYIIYYDNANAQHAFYKQDYVIRCSNLC